LHEPAEILAQLQQAADVYALPQCKAIAIPCEGYVKLFDYYFGNTFNAKFINLHSPGCITRNIRVKLESAPNFICLASEYELKGVDLLIAAWLSIENKHNAKLTIACPNVPEAVIRRLEKEITFVQKAPLSNEEKHALLSSSSVTVAPMHVHGGGNIFEGMEYGHAVIYFETHSVYFKTIGTEISVPYYFYLPSHYGINWKTIREFRDTLRNDKQQGLFDNTVTQLSTAIKLYIDNQVTLYDERIKVMNVARGVASLKERNQKLRNIYLKVLGDEN